MATKAVEWIKRYERSQPGYLKGTALEDRETWGGESMPRLRLGMSDVVEMAVEVEQTVRKYNMLLTRSVLRQQAHTVAKRR
jgi:hypothetical protein